jgi:hypothetical protein
MIVGFTGTRSGCTERQLRSVANVLGCLSVTELHHGACLGADSEVAALCRSYNQAGLRVRVVAHPGVSARGGLNDLRSKQAVEDSDEVREEATHFSRNRTIVRECEVLVACPPTNEEEKIGGTWYSINHARKVGRRVVICWPDGRVTDGK